MSVQSPITHDPTTVRRSFPLPSASGLNSEQLGRWRTMINLSQHPTAVFDQNLRPALFNEALRTKLADPVAIEGTDQPAAFVWQKVCDMAGRLISEANTAGETEIADVIPLHQHFFSVVGSILRNPAGHVVGAMVNLGDVGNASGSMQIAGDATPAGGAAVSDEESERKFSDWMARREQAEQLMSRLSNRESQVVALVSDGLPNKSIAKELDISVKTIEKHRANATRKLGVGSTAEMVRIAVVADNKRPVVDRTEPAPDAGPVSPPNFLPLQ